MEVERVVCAGYVMEVSELKMSWMQDVYRTRPVNVNLGIAIRPHRKPLGKEPLKVKCCPRLMPSSFPFRVGHFEKGGVEGEVGLVHEHY